MAKDSKKTLTEVLAANLRRARGDQTQDEWVAHVRERSGIDWARVTLSDIENGERPLTVDELLGLVAAGVVDPDDLLAGAGNIDLGGATVALAGLRSLFADASARRAVAKVPRQPDRWVRGEAEAKAARKLGVTVDAVDRAALYLWRRSLTAERDRRVAARGDVEPRARQAVRGHVTRELLAELEPAVRDGRAEITDADVDRLYTPGDAARVRRIRARKAGR